MDGVRIDERAAADLTAEEAQRRMEDGTIAGGMALKVRVALEASAAGIPEVVIAGKARLLGEFPGTRIVAVGRPEAGRRDGDSDNEQYRNPHDRIPSGHEVKR